MSHQSDLITTDIEKYLKDKEELNNISLPKSNDGY